MTTPAGFTAGVSAANPVAAGGLGVGGPVAMPAGMHLPNTGSGGVAPSSSIGFLVALSVISAAVGLICALLGRRRELENDGVSVASVPVHWT